MRSPKIDLGIEHILLGVENLLILFRTTHVLKVDSDFRNHAPRVKSSALK